MKQSLRLSILVLPLAVVLGAAASVAYPLDGVERARVRRLLGYQAAQEAAGGAKLPAGALLSVNEVVLHLTGIGREWDSATMAKDPQLQAALESIFSDRDPSYGAVLIDISDPRAIAWAGVRENFTQLPGSVGKTLCLVALFDGLRRRYPEPEDRLRLLREREIVADSWASGDSHQVPKYDPETSRNRFSAVVVGDRFTLSEWIDHMMSASANSAGAMVWKEAMLLRQFGDRYPPSAEEAAEFWRTTNGADLSRLSLQVIEEPLVAAGLDTTVLRQGTFWTRTSSAKVPGVSSYASAFELARLLLRLEQGRLVDEWSSREMKRYYYMTKRRYRYVYAPELADAAVYFKSGSFYQCKPEQGFTCRKYEGNERNVMNSIAVIETPARAGESQKVYIVALLSNVLRVNSAWDHSRIGAAIDEVVKTRLPTVVHEQGSARDLQEVGKSD